MPDPTPQPDANTISVIPKIPREVEVPPRTDSPPVAELLPNDLPPHEKVKTFPTTPGIYLMKDSVGRVIYIGKAVNLRSRASSYFTKIAAEDSRTANLVPEICDIDFIPS